MARGRTILTVAAVAAAAAAAAWLAPGEAASPGGSSGALRASPAAGRAAQDTPSAADTTAAGRAIRAHRTARRGPEQPIPFNHAFHVTDLKIQCEYCHTGSDDRQVATMPPMGVCMGCHRSVGSGLEPIERMREAWNEDRVIRWERIYKLPEFVQFSHRAHLRNRIDCQECHGPVGEMDRVYQFSSLRMGWCLECHRGEPQPSDTATTYQLVRTHEFPDIPAGRQSVGLYPRRIDANYGETRGPVDCAACHY